MGRTQAVHNQYEQSHFTCCTTRPAASKAFYTNTPRVVNKIIAMRDCVGYVYVVVMPITSSGAAQWYTKCFLPLLDGLGISTKRCRSMTFFDMFHHWNERLKFFTAPHGLRACSLSTMFPTYEQSHGVVGALN